MTVPDHDEAVRALQAIRRATDLADLAERIAFKDKCQAKASKEIAEIAGLNARNVARALTRPLPLFDEADGVTPPADAPEPGVKETIGRKIRSGRKAEATPEPEAAKPLPLDDLSICDLILPDEVRKALADFGMVRMVTVLAFHKAGVEWTNVPGIDEGGARRLETAINRLLAGEPQEPGERPGEGKAA